MPRCLPCSVLHFWGKSCLHDWRRRPNRCSLNFRSTGKRQPQKHLRELTSWPFCSVLNHLLLPSQVQVQLRKPWKMLLLHGRVESSRVLFIVAACWSSDDHIPKVETSRFCRRIWKGTWIFSTLSASGTTKDADASDWKVHLSYYYSLRAYVILSTVTCLQLVQLLTTHVIFPKNCLAGWWLTDSCFFLSFSSSWWQKMAQTWACWGEPLFIALFKFHFLFFKKKNIRKNEFWEE